MPQKPRQTFTPEQKAEAVSIVKQSSKPVSQVARELGLTESTLRKWVKQAVIDQGTGQPGGLSTQERGELTALRKELKRVQMERDFLKKAAGSESKNSGRAKLKESSQISSAKYGMSFV